MKNLARLPLFLDMSEQAIIQPIHIDDRCILVRLIFENRLNLKFSCKTQFILATGSEAVTWFEYLKQLKLNNLKTENKLNLQVLAYFKQIKIFTNIKSKFVKKILKSIKFFNIDFLSYQSIFLMQAGSQDNMFIREKYGICNYSELEFKKRRLSCFVDNLHVVVNRSQIKDNQWIETAILAFIWLYTAYVSLFRWNIDISISWVQQAVSYFCELLSYSKNSCGNVNLYNYLFYSSSFLDGLYGLVCGYFLIFFKSNHFLGIKKVWWYMAQLATVIVYSIILALALPWTVTMPFGPLLKNIPIVYLLIREIRNSKNSI